MFHPCSSLKPCVSMNIVKGQYLTNDEIVCSLQLLLCSVVRLLKGIVNLLLWCAVIDKSLTTLDLLSLDRKQSFQNWPLASQGYLVRLRDLHQNGKYCISLLCWQSLRPLIPAGYEMQHVIRDPHNSKVEILYWHSYLSDCLKASNYYIFVTKITVFSLVI